MAPVSSTICQTCAVSFIYSPGWEQGDYCVRCVGGYVGRLQRELEEAQQQVASLEGSEISKEEEISRLEDGVDKALVRLKEAVDPETDNWTKGEIFDLLNLSISDLKRARR